MAILRGKLVHQAADSWVGYRVTAAWSERAEQGAPPASRFRSAAVDASGSFELALPEPSTALGPIDLAANAPTGDLVYRTSLPAPAGDVVQSYTTSSFVKPVVADADAPPDAPPRLRGRAMRFDGQPARAGETVVLWGVPPGGGDRDAWPLLVTLVEPGGYFGGDRPSRTFARAFGAVGGAAAIPLALEEGRVPAQVVLVGEVPLGEPTDADCACDALTPPRAPGHEGLTSNPDAYSIDLGGRCVDLTVPNRALEEVSWYAVVRTSEPTVRRFTLEDPKPLPTSIVDKIKKIAFRVQDATRMRTEPGDRDPSPSPLPDALAAAADFRLDARHAARVLRTGEPLRDTAVVDVDRATRFELVRDLLRKKTKAPPSRPPLDADNLVDWDETPTMSQATSIAHGHLLTLRQTWHADGYSLGDLLYSLPLAPGQKKNIATVDWDRRDTVMRLSDRETRETLAAMIERDRDVEEIVRGALDESVRAGSKATRSSVGGGFGLAIGPIVIGGGGGSAWASSSGWQTGARDVAGMSLQQVRDRTLQSASATRSQRTTVVQAVEQHESVRAETTTVANYNHCHALTMQYFEVLRHFRVTQEIVGVRECLFVPFTLSEFDIEKALRWREPLMRALRRRDLRDAFDAAERVRTNWVGAHVPQGAYADELLRWLDAELTLTIELPRPKDTEQGGYDSATWAPYAHLLTRPPEEEWRLWLGVVTAAERDRVWATRIAPRVARRIVGNFALEAILPGNTSASISIDATLVSTWRAGSGQLVTLRPRGVLQHRRSGIIGFRLSTSAPIPSVAKVVVERGTMRYRTAYTEHAFFTNRLLQNDLATNDVVEIPVRLDREEKRRPRDEDRQKTRALLEHLNAHLEYFHRAIWLAMHPNRRYMLLDGFEAPNAGGRSVASVVENRLIGIVGNCMVFPLAPGEHLDPGTNIPPDASGDLLAYYNASPPPPVRLSVPTRGVFAEAITGACNSCEVKDESRFWRWEEAEIPDKPPELGTVSTASRRRSRGALRPDAFSTPLIGMQTSPDLPAPTALKAALDLIGTPELFRDLTGVDVNVKHAAEALTSALGAAQFFGGEAAKLAQQRFLAKNRERVVKSIADAKAKGLITDEEASDLTTRALGGSVGGQQQSNPLPTQTTPVKRVMDRAKRSDNGSVTVERPSGSVSVRTGNDPKNETYDFKVDPAVRAVAQTDRLDCWAAAGAMMVNWKDGGTRTAESLVAELGDGWAATLEAKTGLDAPTLRAFASVLGLVEERPTSLTARGFLRLLAEHGPLWIVVDDFAENNKLVHARIATGIAGKGQGDDATVTMLDPAAGTQVTETFSSVAKRLSSTDPTIFDVGILRHP